MIMMTMMTMMTPMKMAGMIMMMINDYNNDDEMKVAVVMMTLLGILAQHQVCHINIFTIVMLIKENHSYTK